MKIHFILVSPKVPENIGFVCRAIKTMGFHSLRIVNSQQHLEHGAKKTAYESHDVLTSIVAFDTLQEAVQDMDFVIGTTAHDRSLRKEYIAPKDISSFLDNKKAICNQVAIVFGSEENGLSNNEIALCDILSQVEMKVSYPSLNLSHSVMIYAYELSKIPHSTQQIVHDENIQKELIHTSDDVLKNLGVAKHPVLYHRLKERIATLNTNDSRLVLSLLRHLKRLIQKK